MKPRPSWKDPLRLGLAGLTTLLIAGSSVWAFSATAHTLSERSKTEFELVALVMIGALTLISAVQLNAAIVDLIVARSAVRLGHVVEPIDWRTAYQALEAALYRFIGKAFLSVAIGLVVALRNDDVRAWMAGHPLLIVLLIVNAMIVFSIVDVSELLFRVDLAFTPPETTVAELVRDLTERVVVVEHRTQVHEAILAETVLPHTDTALDALPPGSGQSPEAPPRPGGLPEPEQTRPQEIPNDTTIE